jgi:hypothetical protein
MKPAAAFWRNKGKSDGLDARCGVECRTRQSVKAPGTQQKVPLRPHTPPWVYFPCASLLVYMEMQRHRLPWSMADLS